MKNFYLFLLLLFLACNESSSSKDFVAKINDEIISVPEFELQMKKNKAMVYNYFYEKHDVDDSVNFWSASFKGEKPIDLLKKKTLDACIQIKVQQILANKNNIIQDISYTAFLKDFQKENGRRKSVSKSKQIIYGPTELTEQIYFDYIFSNMVIELKEYLAENNFKIDESRIEKYYQNNKEDFLKNYENESEGYIDFLSVKEHIKFICIDKDYSALVDSLTKTAKIEINANIYNTLQIQ